MCTVYFANMWSLQDLETNSWEGIYSFQYRYVAGYIYEVLFVTRLLMKNLQYFQILCKIIIFNECFLFGFIELLIAQNYFVRPLGTKIMLKYATIFKKACKHLIRVV